MLFDKSFDDVIGRAVTVDNSIRRITANNPGPFTFKGTNSYIIGSGQVAIVDPGPDDPAHIAALLNATKGEEITHIIVTHTHRDHSPAARVLAERTGAEICGEGPHRPARDLRIGEINPLDSSGDDTFRPSVLLRDGDVVSGDDWKLEVVATPGHTDNHLAIALMGTEHLFCGDHVMAWSTTIVAPPDGSMADYMTSLDRLRARPETTYHSGHGATISSAHEHVERLIAHRRGRESAILGELERGGLDIPGMVSRLYADVPKHLHGAAALSVLAHLEDLAMRGLVVAEPELAIDARYSLS